MYGKHTAAALVQCNERLLPSKRHFVCALDEEWRACGGDAEGVLQYSKWISAKRMAHESTRGGKAFLGDNDL